MKKILVPVCIDCGKPHYGRENKEDRCWCDTSGRFVMQEIKAECECDCHEPNYGDKFAALPKGCKHCATHPPEEESK